jgi:glycosyltransferase involved in cell wall biosynthesis
VIHAHGSLSSILIGRFGGPVIYTEHDAPPWHCRYRRWWERAIRTIVYRAFNVPAQRRADAVIALFDEHGEEMRERWKARAVSVIANAADAEAFYPDASRRRRRAAEASGSGTSDRRRYGFERYCLFAGELSSRKAPDVLLKALADAPGVCCVIAGDGPMRGQLEQLVEKLEISDRVTFLGRQSSENLARIYADADLLVLPSVSEAAPLVVAEAMACGTPVIATRIAGIPALVRNGDTGFLVEPEDVDGLAAALRTAMASDDLLAEMSKRAFLFVREALAWSAVAGEHEGAYLSLLADEPPSGPRSRNGTTVPARKRERRLPRLVRS